MNQSICFKPADFSQELLEWWAKNKRDFPWRRTHDPYKVLISEILLHRTRAEQVVPIYQKFLEKFPTINDLADASLPEIRNVLLPLGLYWRTNYLHEMAKLIVKDYNSSIPSTKSELMLLPGIGPYISSAILCFSFNRPEYLLDTNIVRILGRIFEIKVTDGSRRSKNFQALSKLILDKKSPRTFNYALIDLGALICVSKEPFCTICPVNQLCKYGLQRIHATNQIKSRKIP